MVLKIYWIDTIKYNFKMYSNNWIITTDIIHQQKPDVNSSGRTPWKESNTATADPVISSARYIRNEKMTEE